MKKLKAYHIKTIGHFEIYKTRNAKFDRQYIIWNKHYDFRDGHTHRFTLGECESIIQDILNYVEPSRKAGWRQFNDLLMSYMRLSEDSVYMTHILNLCNDKNIRIDLMKLI